jgi:hypothetical protein
MRRGDDSAGSDPLFAAMHERGPNRGGSAFFVNKALHFRRNPNLTRPSYEKFAPSIVKSAGCGNDGLRNWAPSAQKQPLRVAK